MKTIVVALLSFYFCQVSTPIIAQNIISDTTVYFIYDKYCESIMAEDYLVSDGLPEKEGFKYPLAFCSSSFLADSYYSFKDFVLVIGDNHFQYSYPSRLYNIEWSYFIEHIDSVSLYNRKTDELIKIDEIELKYNSKDSLHFMPGSINAKKELSHRLFADSQLEVWIPPLNYPIDCDFNCGKVSLAFLPIKLQLRD